jgi:leucyl aminopeptidase
MTNLHIQSKKQKNLLNLKAVTKKDKISDLVEKKDGKITLISEEKTYYLYLDKQTEDYNFHKIYNFFVDFSRNNKRNLNIEVSSFVSPKLSEELVIQAISEGILFGSHKEISYKSKEEGENK